MQSPQEADAADETFRPTPSPSAAPGTSPSPPTSSRPAAAPIHHHRQHLRRRTPLLHRSQTPISNRHPQAQKFTISTSSSSSLDGSATSESPALIPTLYHDRFNTSYVYDRGHYHYISTRLLEPVDNNPVQISADDKTITLIPPTAGNYALVIRDPKSGAWTTLPIYATADQGTAWSDSISRENPERLEITLSSNIGPFVSGNKTPYVIDNGTIGSKPKIDDLPTFLPNQSIKALIKSPFLGELLLTVETDDVLLQRVIPMTENSTEVTLDIPAAAWPTAYVSATVIRAVDPTAAWRTHRAFGLAAFKVDASLHELAIKINAPKEVRPTRTLDLSASITNPDGSPAAGAQVALWAVDEGILSVTNYSTPNPLAYFSAKRALGVSGYDIFAQLMPEVRPDSASLVGGDKDADSGPANLGRYRSSVEAKRFVPLALVPQLATAGPDGIARVSLNVPEFMGQFRIMAVAARARQNGPRQHPRLRPLTRHGPKQPPPLPRPRRYVRPPVHHLQQHPHPRRRHHQNRQHSGHK